MYNRGFTERYLQPVIPMFCEKYVQCLDVPYDSERSSGLKTEIMKSISCLILKSSKYMTSFLPQILPSIWTTLTQSAQIYQEQIVHGNGDVSNQEVDSDGKSFYLTIKVDETLS